MFCVLSIEGKFVAYVQTDTEEDFRRFVKLITNKPFELSALKVCPVSECRGGLLGVADLVQAIRKHTTPDTVPEIVKARPSSEMLDMLEAMLSMLEQHKGELSPDEYEWFQAISCKVADLRQPGAHDEVGNG